MQVQQKTCEETQTQVQAQTYVQKNRHRHTSKHTMMHRKANKLVTCRVSMLYVYNSEWKEKETIPDCAVQKSHQWTNHPLISCETGQEGIVDDSIHQDQDYLLESYSRRRGKIKCVMSTETNFDFSVQWRWNFGLFTGRVGCWNIGVGGWQTFYVNSVLYVSYMWDNFDNFDGANVCDKCCIVSTQKSTVMYPAVLAYWKLTFTPWRTIYTYCDLRAEQKNEDCWSCCPKRDGDCKPVVGVPKEVYWSERRESTGK